MLTPRSKPLLVHVEKIKHMQESERQKIFDSTKGEQKEAKSPQKEVHGSVKEAKSPAKAPSSAGGVLTLPKETKSPIKSSNNAPLIVFQKDRSIEDCEGDLVVPAEDVCHAHKCADQGFICEKGMGPAGLRLAAAAYRKRLLKTPPSQDDEEEEERSATSASVPIARSTRAAVRVSGAKLLPGLK